jgi:hypothetical protein
MAIWPSENGAVISTEPTTETVVAATDLITPVGPRVRWSGVMSGFVVAIGTLMLLGALGLAVGITALGDPRAASGETAAGLGIGAGIWAVITLLVSIFLGGMVSTKVTDRPDRPGAVIHGTLVWVLFSLFVVWLIASGMSLGFTGLFSAVGSLTRGATAVAGAGGDLAKSLGVDDPNRVMAALDDPKTASVLAAATGMSTDEAQAALGTLRSRVEAVKDDPARVTTEVRDFLAQYSERAKQQALAAAAKAQHSATIGSWITFGVMVVTLGVSIVGAMRGVPSLRRWRTPVIEARG